MLSGSSSWSRRAGAKAPTGFLRSGHRHTSRAGRRAPGAGRRAPGDTVSCVLAGGVSRWLVGESHDQRRVERAVCRSGVTRRGCCGDRAGATEIPS
jgi:hypothetical protein